MASCPQVEVVISVGATELVDTAVLDTGFDGAAIIPESDAVSIDQEAEHTTLILGDGRAKEVETWDGTLLIAERTFGVPVKACGKDYVIGVEVLSELSIHLEFGAPPFLRSERTSFPCRMQIPRKPTRRQVR